MAFIFITGSTDGLGRAAAQALIGQGHRVVLHARSQQRAATLADLSSRSAGIVVGDLRSAVETRSIADQVNVIGRMDAVIHNAGIYTVPSRSPTPEGHASTLAVNTLAPYMLTALIERPRRLIYLSSGMHRGGTGPLHDIDWTERRWDTTRAYSESKLYVAALALAVARHWPEVLSQAVDPGWVPTRMGGAGAPDDLEEGHRTQTWLAMSDDPAAVVSGGYWYHRKRQAPAARSIEPCFPGQAYGQTCGINNRVLCSRARHDRPPVALPLVKVGKTDAVVARQKGKGWAIYLNTLFDKYPRLRANKFGGEQYRSLVARLLDRAGVKTSVQLLTSSGSQLTQAQVARYRFGDAEIVTVVKDNLGAAGVVGQDGVTTYNDATLGQVAKQEIVVKLPKKFFVTDVRTGKKLGYTDTVHTSLVVGDAAVLSLSDGENKLILNGT